MVVLDLSSFILIKIVYFKRTNLKNRRKTQPSRYPKPHSIMRENMFQEIMTKNFPYLLKKKIYKLKKFSKSQAG